MPRAPVLTSLATVQESQQGGRASQELASRLGSGVSPAYPCAPQPGEC